MSSICLCNISPRNRPHYRGHLGLQTFLHILNDPRTQDIPLVLETPAFDVTSGANKNQFKPGAGWDIWQSEVAMLHRLAGSQTAEGSEALDLEKCTEGLRSVVERVSALQAQADAGKKDKATKKRAPKKGKSTAAEQDDEDGDSDEGHSDNV